MGPLTREVAQVVALRDPVVRNHRITWCYHELALELRRRMDPDAGANWCTFGAWASRQAGSTIRGEDLRRTLERSLEGAATVIRALEAAAAAARSAGATVDTARLRGALPFLLEVEAAGARAAAAVARGNVLVFGEIAMAVAHFLEATERSPAGGLEEALEPLEHGEPPAGQEPLRRALRRYDGLLGGGGGDGRRQLLLLGNVEIGFQEQTRLQPVIAAAVDAALPDLDAARERVLSFLFQGRDSWRRLREILWRRMGRPGPLDSAILHLLEAARGVMRRGITEHLMTLDLPGGRTIRLGGDLQGVFPEGLERIDHPELAALLARIDPTPDSLQGSGARNWAILDDRLHFITDLFRLHQHDGSLFTPPLDATVVAAARAHHTG